MTADIRPSAQHVKSGTTLGPRRGRRPEDVTDDDGE
jgi:hypothetical protein